ncbi:UNVERIFIED_CONTAM: hypothetical protein Sangu_1203400 [Sesamum angustifolium]|uniref:Uncharacterized protein n=1 Tax=Sesamum angustifolium TaxID=2727405 RepID=A0AAW2NIA0_9LAMI
MNSFEEENLYQFQMFDDCLHSESASQTPLLPDTSNFLSRHQTKYYILQEIVESGTKAEADVLGRVVKHLRQKSADDGLMKKWVVKNLRKDGYSAALRRSCWPTTLNCPGGEHEYIDITSEGKKGSSGLRLIVDIDFKSQFELARPTPNYKDLCDVLPTIFVGDEQKLKNIISILCSEAEKSFHERGLHVPPWRTPYYMQLKWFSPPQNRPPELSVRRRVRGENRAVEAGDRVVAAAEFLSGRRKYLGVDQCGLSSQFSAMRMECS